MIKLSDIREKEEANYHHPCCDCLACENTRAILHYIDPGTATGVKTVTTNSVGEVRITDPTTGGEKGSKLARFDLLPPEAMWALAEHYGVGAKKYSDHNWKKGYAWSLSLAALMRHLYQWIGGEARDSETGSHHLIAVAWHAFALFTYEMRGLGTDDVRRR